MDFDSLPLEMKSHIFSYLSFDNLYFKVASVSKKWQELSRDPHVVKRIEIDYRFVPEEITQCLVTYNFARSLKITKIFDFNWVLNIPVNNNLRRLRIDDCSFKIETLQILSTRFPMISKLKILDCKYLWYAIPISNFVNISSDCLRLFSENCRRLEEVEIIIYYSVNETSCQTLLNLHGKTLTRLKLFGEALTDKNFTNLTQCSRITDLHLCWVNKMTDYQLLNIKKLRSLRNLSITGASNVSSNAITKLFTEPTFPHLQFINFSNGVISDDDVTLISKSYPNLKSLNLKNCFKITNSGVKSIIENCSVLENLNLSINCDVTEYILTLLSTTRVPYLKFLDIYGCDCEVIDSELYRQKLMRLNPELRVIDKGNFDIYSGYFHTFNML